MYAFCVRVSSLKGRAGSCRRARNSRRSSHGGSCHILIGLVATLVIRLVFSGPQKEKCLIRHRLLEGKCQADDYVLQKVIRLRADQEL